MEKKIFFEEKHGFHFIWTDFHQTSHASIRPGLELTGSF